MCKQERIRLSACVQWSCRITRTFLGRKGTEVAESLSARGLCDRSRSKTGQKGPNLTETKASRAQGRTVRTHRVAINTTKDPTRLQKVYSDKYCGRNVCFSPENGHNSPKNDPKFDKRPQRIQIWVNRSIFWGKKHKDRHHWATATLLRKLSCRNMEFWPKNDQKRPINDPKFEKRAPEGPDLGKFDDFLDILSNWA